MGKKETKNIFEKLKIVQWLSKVLYYFVIVYILASKFHLYHILYKAGVKLDELLADVFEKERALVEAMLLWLRRGIWINCTLQESLRNKMQHRGSRQIR